jgi:hypothetical protein
MAECCPPGRGCNSPNGDEVCALTLCGVDKHEPDAALALARWEELQHTAAQERRERRFRRRAFERARDRALQALAMRIRPGMLRRPRRSLSSATPPQRRRTRLTRRAAA